MQLHHSLLCGIDEEEQTERKFTAFLKRKSEEEAGCKILLAQKAFSCFYEYPLIGQYLRRHNSQRSV